MEKFLDFLVYIPDVFDYLIIFGILIICGLGLPLPEDIPLIASGYLIWQGSLHWLPTLFVTISAVLIGDTILFWIGRKIGVRYLEKRRSTSWANPERIRKVETWFKKYGAGVIFLARFVMGLRSVVFLLAGAMRMKYWIFLSLDGLAALLSVPLWIALGYWLSLHFGEDVSGFLRHANNLKTIFTVAVVLAVVIVGVRIYFQVRKAQKAKLSTKVPEKISKRKAVKKKTVRRRG